MTATSVRMYGMVGIVTRAGGDHEPVIDKIDELLTGTLVIIVDCYADIVVRNIVAFFDVDLPHPHHFVTDDILKMFSGYKLIKQNSKISHILQETTFKDQQNKIEIYRIDKFITRLKQHLSSSRKKGGRLFIFTVKYILCYSLALLVSLLRRKEKQIHPLNKPHLFVFQKSR